MENARERIDELRLLIVADHRLVREGLAALFRADGATEAVTSALDEAVWVTERFCPAVVLLGITLPGCRGLRTGRSIMALSSPPGLIYLDEMVRPAHICSALAAGASGYWTKHASFDQLADGVRRVAAGESSFCPAARRYFNSTVNIAHPSHHLPEAAKLSALTRRESQVLMLLAEGLSVRECAQRLELSPSTIDNYKSRLMKKLRVHKVASLVRLAVREGLVGW